MLYSPKKLSNDSSPGINGFTPAFFFSWIDLGHFLVRSTNGAYDSGELSVSQKQEIDFNYMHTKRGQR